MEVTGQIHVSAAC